MVAVKQDQNLGGSGSRKLSRTLDLGAHSLQLGSRTFTILPGQNERFESGQDAWDAGGGGSRAQEAVNETGAPKQAGKGGKGQRAVDEGEKGKLQPGGRGRRSRTGREPREDGKAGRGKRAELGQGQARAAEGTRRGPGPTQAASAGVGRDQGLTNPEEATRGQVGPGSRDVVPRPLPVASGLSPPRS